MANQTTGLGVAAQVVVAGNVNDGVTTPGLNNVFLSLSGDNGDTTFQLAPTIEDAAGNSLGSLTLTAVATSVPGAFTLSAAAVDGVYTGTITGGGSNAFAGYTFTVAGFTTGSNNGTFVCTASTTTTLTLTNVASAAETHAGTATATTGTAVYTGTITGGGSNAFVGESFKIAGFTTSANNGTFNCTASNTTTLTLANASAAAETHAATAQNAQATGTITYVAYGFSSLADGTTGLLPPNEAPTAIATVSDSGLITAVTEGATTVEVSYPAFDNALGDIVSTGNIMNGLPIQKVYAEVNVTVGA